jgi:flavorubredoxin
MITNQESRTNVEEIAQDIYRINTPVPMPDGSGSFNFNQYLIVDDEPLLFHTGQRRMFPLVREAIETIMPVSRLRYLGLSHFEADECGSLNEFLAVAPSAVPLCGKVAAMVAISDVADREPKVLADGETLELGEHIVRWFDTPHLPHAWECGLLMDIRTRTFFCGDLFTQGGTGEKALTEADILGPSEAMRASMDYYAHSPDTQIQLERLAREQPQTLACMHGSAWRGDGGELLRELGGLLSAERDRAYGRTTDAPAIKSACA